jgi:hypothetical protein
MIGSQLDRDRAGHQIDGTRTRTAKRRTTHRFLGVHKRGSGPPFFPQESQKIGGCGGPRGVPSDRGVIAVTPKDRGML